MSSLDEAKSCNECDNKTHINSCRQNKRGGFVAWIAADFTDIKHRCERFTPLKPTKVKND